MATMTQDVRFHPSLIKYAERFGVTKAAIKYKPNRQYVYRWKRRCDGSIESLRDLPRRPHHHPNQHTPDEAKLISDVRRRNPDVGLVVFWGSAVIPVPSPAFTVSSSARASWPSILPILSMFQSPMSRWTTPDSASRWM